MAPAFARPEPRPTRPRAPLFLLFAVLWTVSAPAQEVDPAPAGEHEPAAAVEIEHSHEHHSHEVETFSPSVTVTGSWIPGTPEDAAQPVSVLSRDDLEAEGSPSMLGVIRNLSFSLGADLESDQFGSRGGEDRSTLNLRGLGPSRSLVLRPYAENPRGGWSGTGRPAVFYPLSGAAGIRDPNCERVGGGVSSPDSPLCRVQYTPFDNLVQDTRRGQWFTEGSWDTEGGWHLGAEYLLASSDVPSWQTSPSYPPNEVVDPTRSVRANNPGLVDMARLYPELYGPYAFCDAPYCGWRGDGDAQDAAGIQPAWQEVAWLRGRMFGQGGPLRSHIRESDTDRLAFDLEGVTGETLWAFRASWSTAVRKFEDGDALDYRARRALAGLRGFACEEQVPNEYDASASLSFSLGTLRRHAGQGDCSYWTAFSNSIKPHPLVPAAPNPDYDPAFDNSPSTST